MSDDALLKKATSALHESGSQASPDHTTRFRVLARVREAERSRRTRLTVVLPLAAIFIGSTAWAGAGGGLEHLVEALTRPATPASGESDVAPVASVTVQRRAHMPQEATAEKPASEDQVAEEDDARSDVEAPPPEPAEQQAEIVRLPQVASDDSFSRTVPQDAGALDLQLYREAHDAHFGARDYGRAIERYDEYLASAPNGTFALEARYNRALCLIRLQRKQEAIRALQLFAHGVAGGYRQEQARALLDAL